MRGIKKFALALHDEGIAVAGLPSLIVSLIGRYVEASTQRSFVAVPVTSFDVLPGLSCLEINRCNTVDRLAADDVQFAFETALRISSARLFPVGGAPTSPRVEVEPEMFGIPDIVGPDGAPGVSFNDLLRDAPAGVEEDISRSSDLTVDP